MAPDEVEEIRRSTLAFFAEDVEVAPDRDTIPAMPWESPTSGPAPGAPVAPEPAPEARSPKTPARWRARGLVVGGLALAIALTTWIARQAPRAVPAGADVGGSARADLAAPTRADLAAPARADLAPPARAGVARIEPERLAPTAAGRPAAVPPPEPRPIAIDVDASTEVDLLAGLRTALPADDAAGVPPSTPGESPTLAVLRYDALQAAPPGWRLLAPLHLEAAYAIVRADSPLHYLHELRGRRVDLGVPASARAASGRALYQRLFGVAPPHAADAGLPRDAALDRLLAGIGPEALLLFDGRSSPWLAALAPDVRARLRLLALAPADAMSRRALQSYLPTRVAPLGSEAAAPPVTTLGVVSFLAAAPGAAGLEALARDLCARLPALRRQGGPEWREVSPTLRLPTALPAAPEFTAAWDHCADPPPPPPGA